jgi:hypothetical protein
VRKLFFRIDGDAFRIKGPSKFRRIKSVGDERDLGSRKSDDLIGGAIPEVSIEIMKIPAARSKDDYSDGFAL